MFTVCPKCALTLVVTAADLKVAQGSVRCGRCSNVFNAIATLSDERQAAAAAQEPQAPEATPPAQDTEEYVEPEPPVGELEFNPAATNVADVFVEPPIGDDEETGTFEAIVLESGEPDPALPDETAAPDPDKELEQALQSLAERIEAEGHPKAPAPIIPIEPEIQPLQLQAESESEEDERKRPWLWRLGAAALVLALAAQALHHYRHDLAVNPRLNGPLTTLYDALGVSLVPSWSLGAYEVHQLGAATSPANDEQLIVRASLKNGARHPQPLPLLRVVIQDRFGNRIAARDVAPESYAPRARSLLAAGQRIDVEMRFVDPGRDAVGFEIDACLPRPGGAVVCGNAR